MTEQVPHSIEPKFLRIAETLRTVVLAKDYPPHSKLQPERRLKQLFNVDRATIRKAVNELVTDGLVEKKGNLGTFILADQEELQQTRDELSPKPENTARSRLTIRPDPSPTDHELYIRSDPVDQALSEMLTDHLRTSVVTTAVAPAQKDIVDLTDELEPFPVNEDIVTDLAGRETEEEKQHNLSARLRRPDNPYLTKSQERRLYIHMHTPGHTTMDLLTDEVFVKDIDRKDRLKWLRVFRYGQDFGDIMVAANLGFLFQKTKVLSARLLAWDIPFPNLLDAGEQGIRRALKTYNPDFTSKQDKPVTFMSYSRGWIQHYIQEEIAHQNGIGRNLYEKINEAIYLKYAFTQTIGRSPTLDELREQLVFNSNLGITARDNVINFFESRYTQFYERALSTDKPLYHDSGTTLYDVISPAVSVDEEKETLIESLSTLTPVQLAVVTALTGMNEEERIVPVNEVTSKLGITETEIHHHLQEALVTFRNDPKLALFGKERTGAHIDLITDTEPDSSTHDVFTLELAAISGQQLEKKEQLIATLKNEGFTNDEMASHLHISKSQLKRSVTKLYAAGILKTSQERDRLEKEKPPSKYIALVEAWLKTHKKTNLYSYAK